MLEVCIFSDVNYDMKKLHHSKGRRKQKVKLLQSRLSDLKARLRSVTDERSAKQRMLRKMRSEVARAEKLEANIAQLKQAKTRIIKRQADREAAHRSWMSQMKQKCRRLEKIASKNKNIIKLSFLKK